MTNEEILTKAIEKAVNNGYLNHHESAKRTASVWLQDCKLEHFIFDHKFARAFFPPPTVIEDNITWKTPDWTHHLQQMVIQEDPIKYLEKYV